jgi:hypothetical protein
MERDTHNCNGHFSGLYEAQPQEQCLEPVTPVIHSPTRRPPWHCTACGWNWKGLYGKCNPQVQTALSTPPSPALHWAWTAEEGIIIPANSIWGRPRKVRKINMWLITKAAPLTEPHLIGRLYVWCVYAGMYVHMCLWCVGWSVYCTVCVPMHVCACVVQYCDVCGICIAGACCVCMCIYTCSVVWVWFVWYMWMFHRDDIYFENHTYILGIT